MKYPFVITCKLLQHHQYDFNYLPIQFHNNYYQFDLLASKLYLIKSPVLLHKSFYNKFLNNF